MRTRDAAGRAPLMLELGPLDPQGSEACARLLARLVVGKAYRNLALDSGSAMCSNVGNPHKEAPPVLETPDRAKE